MSGTYVGTVSFYDSATIAGTADGNLIYTAGLPGLVQPRAVEIHARTRNGLIASAVGTPILSYTYD